MICPVGLRGLLRITTLIPIALRGERQRFRTPETSDTDWILCFSSSMFSLYLSSDRSDIGMGTRRRKHDSMEVYAVYSGECVSTGIVKLSTRGPAWDLERGVYVLEMKRVY